MTIPIISHDSASVAFKHSKPATTSPRPALPWRRTPMIESRALSDILGSRVFLKLELFQPSGSFKSRGIGNFLLRSHSLLPTPPLPNTLTFFISSGGNAGLACVLAARALSQHCTVVVPVPTTSFMKSKLLSAGGKVIVHGNSWMECDIECRRLLEEAQGVMGRERCVYVPPFDDPAIWEGHSWMVDEIVEDLGGVVPDAVVTAVGGGGLLNGLIEGLDRFADRGKGKVVGMETVGADSLGVSLKKGKLVTLESITSIATSLGARRVSERTWELAGKGGKGRVVAKAVSDAEAASACVRFLEDERMAVEVSCGAALAGIYGGYVKEALPGLEEESIIVVVVCGGNSINLDIFEEYKKNYHEPLMAGLNP